MDEIQSKAFLFPILQYMKRLLLIIPLLLLLASCRMETAEERQEACVKSGGYYALSQGCWGSKYEYCTNKASSLPFNEIAGTW